MTSETSRAIQKRTNPNDVFITPLALAKSHIDLIAARDGDTWFDPFKNNGSYYNQFPTENKDWTEILEDKDFFAYEGTPDVICSNPPYSIIDRVLEKSVSLKPRVISYLIGINNLTTRRMEIMENAGYKIRAFHVCKVWKWYGMSAAIVWDNTIDSSAFTFDRTIWR
jgi:hypothetical protein